MSDSRPPRLVMDSSICGVNAQCCMPEHSTLPTAADVIRCYPLRNSQEPLDCFSIDIKSAHKRIAVAAEDRGFLGFQFRGKLCFYRVCPFGAVFSAHYWSRLAGALLDYGVAFHGCPMPVFFTSTTSLCFSVQKCFQCPHA